MTTVCQNLYKAHANEIFTHCIFYLSRPGPRPCRTLMLGSGELLLLFDWLLFLRSADCRVRMQSYQLKKQLHVNKKESAINNSTKVIQRSRNLPWEMFVHFRWFGFRMYRVWASRELVSLSSFDFARNLLPFHILLGLGSKNKTKLNKYLHRIRYKIEQT